MPRLARTIPERWAHFQQVLIIPDGVYEINGNNLFCTYCTVELHNFTEAKVRRHHFNELHQANSDLEAAGSEPSNVSRAQCPSRTHAFYYGLAEALIASDIPFEKLKNSKFLEFLQHYLKNRIPDASTLRTTYVDLVYQKKLEQVRNEVGDNPIYLSIDETSDSMGRLITHAIVAPLIADSFSIRRMIHCAEIPVGNAQTIAEFTEQALSKLWPDRIRKKKVLLFVSDAAPYMMSAGRLLKDNYNYEKLIHVSCLAHGLHRVAEEVRGTYVLVNNVIAETKFLFLKSPRRKRLFHELAPGILLPLQPVVTRWGEWLKAAPYYYCTNFRQVQAVIEQLEPDAAVVIRAQDLWANPNLPQEIQCVHRNYRFISEAITRLEERGMSLRDSAHIFTQVAATIHHNPAIPMNIKQKMQNVFMNNSGFSIHLINICKALQREPNQTLPDGWDLTDVHCMKYAPTTSCEVERSFSNLKNILRPNRQSLTTENLEKLVVVYFNQLDIVEHPG